MKLRLAILFLLCFQSTIAETDHEFLKTQFTERQTILKLYQLMKDVHEILSNKGIDYWVDGGTLLGAIRHKGLIPWDNDLDICIDEKQENDFLALKNIFATLGYNIVKWPKQKDKKMGYQIHYQDAHLDVFLRETVDNKIYYHKTTRWSWGKRGEEPIYHLTEEIFPLRDYQFGSIHVKGPNNPFIYLDVEYGKDWPDIVRILIDHRRKKYDKRSIVLTDEFKVAAMPFGPLIDRTSSVLLPSIGK